MSGDASQWDDLGRKRRAEWDVPRPVDEDEEEFGAALWWQLLSMAQCIASRESAGRMGSAKGKRGNVQRDYGDAHLRYMVHYFWPNDVVRPRLTLRGPSQSEESFERRFRMPRSMFTRILIRLYTAVANESKYMRQGLKPNAAGVLGITPLLKIVTALRQIPYGIPYDLCDDLFEVSETTARKCMKDFCRSIVAVFGDEYLRRPAEEDVLRVEEKFRALGFPGCIGAVDCAGWTWKNAPTWAAFERLYMDRCVCKIGGLWITTKFSPT